MSHLNAVTVLIAAFAKRKSGAQIDGESG